MNLWMAYPMLLWVQTLWSNIASTAKGPRKCSPYSISVR